METRIDAEKSQRAVAELVVAVAALTVRAEREFALAPVGSDAGRRARELLASVLAVQKAVSVAARDCAALSVEWEDLPPAVADGAAYAAAVPLLDRA